MGERAEHTLVTGRPTGGRWRKQFIRAAEDKTFCHRTGRSPARQRWAAAALLPSQKRDLDPISLHCAGPLTRVSCIECRTAAVGCLATSVSGDALLFKLSVSLQTNKPSNYLNTNFQ